MNRASRAHRLDVSKTVSKRLVEGRENTVRAQASFSYLADGIFSFSALFWSP
jgi:hypothetical protein